jgi:hypothetical protein
MNRWFVVPAALVATVLVAGVAGLALTGIGATRQSSATLVLATATPGALDNAGIHLRPAAVPPGCDLLPLRLPGCPVTKATAESAATAAFAPTLPYSPRVREAVLAKVDIYQSGYAPPFHGIDWVVAVDAQFPAVRPAGVAVMMCPMQVPPPAGTRAMPVPMPACGVARYLILVDAWNGHVQRTMGRP